MATASAATLVTWLMAETTMPRLTATAVTTTRVPNRSIRRPTPSAPAAPMIVAQKFSAA